MMRRIILLLVLAVISLGLTTGAHGAVNLEAHACNDPITSSFTLNNDVTGCTGHGLRIMADDISIDLNGHLLQGDGNNTADNGIDNTGGYDNLHVRNGRIRRFGSGVDVSNNADGAVMEKLVVTGNAGYGIEFEEPGQIVRDSLIAGNGELGLEFFGDGNIAERNTVAASGNDGVDFNGGNANRVIENRFLNNDGIGIFIEGNDNLIKRNVVTGSGTEGIDINGDTNIVKKNQVYGSGNDGISVSGDANQIAKNTSSANEDRGIAFTGGTGNVVNENLADSNGYDVTTGFDNVELGIFAASTLVADGSQNIAHGNDDPFECAPSSLCFNAGPQANGGTCGQTFMASTALTQSIVNCPDDGIVVGKSGITIDLNGFQVTSNATPDAGDIGILIPGGIKNVTIKDGEVKGFDNGIAGGERGHTLSKVRVAAAVDNGIELAGIGHTIKGSVVATNRNFGVALSSGSGVAVSKNLIAGNAFEGLDVEAVPNATIGGNRIVGNAGSGVALDNLNRATLERNTIESNGNFGVFTNTTTKVAVLDNRITGNENTGVFFVAGTKPTIDGNRANLNGFDPAGLPPANGAGLGIDAADATDPSGKNTAVGNDNPAECDPDALC